MSSGLECFKRISFFTLHASSESSPPPTYYSTVIYTRGAATLIFTCQEKLSVPQPLPALWALVECTSTRVSGVMDCTQPLVALPPPPSQIATTAANPHSGLPRTAPTAACQYVVLGPIASKVTLERKKRHPDTLSSLRCCFHSSPQVP